MGFVRFQLLDRKVTKDSFFKNSDGTEDHDRKLDFTNTRGVLNPFWVIDKETGGRKQYRYIQGCSFFDVERQEKEKIPFNFQTGTIEFQKGADIILEEEFMMPLINFLRIHPLNPGTISKPNLNHDKTRHDAVFVEADPKEALKQEVAAADLEDEAMDIYRSLIKEPERMRSVAMLFEETKQLADDVEIQVALRLVAKTSPALFTSSIANVKNKVFSDVGIALKYGVIGKDAKGFLYEGEGGARIFETAAKGKNVAEDTLVTFLMSKEGDVIYRQLLIKIRQKEIEMDAPVGDLG